MNEYLKISLLQIDLFHKDKKKNLSNIDNLVCDMENTDIILLPEMFNTSFCPFDISLAEDTNGETVAWMKSLSKKKSCAVAGTLMIRENNKIYNRLIWISKDGSLHSYDKRHLFSLIKEQKTISKGDKRNIIIEDGWRICPLICYDLRFPVFCRNNDDYDVLIFLSSWPEKRIDAWNTLLKARAIENQCVSVGINRVGKDNSDIYFPGSSSVYDAFGKNLLNLGDKVDVIKSIAISRDDLQLKRRQINFLQDRDNFTIH